MYSSHSLAGYPIGLLHLFPFSNIYFSELNEPFASLVVRPIAALKGALLKHAEKPVMAVPHSSARRSQRSRKHKAICVCGSLLQRRVRKDSRKATLTIAGTEIRSEKARILNNFPKGANKSATFKAAHDAYRAMRAQKNASYNTGPSRNRMETRSKKDRTGPPTLILQSV